MARCDSWWNSLLASLFFIPQSHSQTSIFPSTFRHSLCSIRNPNSPPDPGNKNRAHHNFILLKISYFRCFCCKCWLFFFFFLNFWVMQSYRAGYLDAIFSGLSCVVSVPFYTAFIPMLFWVCIIWWYYTKFWVKNCKFIGIWLLCRVVMVNWLGRWRCWWRFVII